MHALHVGHGLPPGVRGQTHASCNALSLPYLFDQNPSTEFSLAFQELEAFACVTSGASN